MQLRRLPSALRKLAHCRAGVQRRAFLPGGVESFGKRQENPTIVPDLEKTATGTEGVNPVRGHVMPDGRVVGDDGKPVVGPDGQILVVSGPDGNQLQLKKGEQLKLNDEGEVVIAKADGTFLAKAGACTWTDPQSALQVAQRTEGQQFYRQDPQPPKRTVGGRASPAQNPLGSLTRPEEDRPRRPGESRPRSAADLSPEEILKGLQPTNVFEQPKRPPKPEKIGGFQVPGGIPMSGDKGDGANYIPDVQEDGTEWPKAGTIEESEEKAQPEKGSSPWKDEKGEFKGYWEPTEEEFDGALKEYMKIDPTTLDAEKRAQYKTQMRQLERMERWAKEGRKLTLGKGQQVFLHPDLPPPGEDFRREAEAAEELRRKQEEADPSLREARELLEQELREEQMRNIKNSRAKLDSSEFPDLNKINNPQSDEEAREAMKKEADLNMMFFLAMGGFVATMVGMIIIPRVWQGSQPRYEEDEPDIISAAYVPRRRAVG